MWESGMVASWMVLKETRLPKSKSSWATHTLYNDGDWASVKRNEGMKGERSGLTQTTVDVMVHFLIMSYAAPFQIIFSLLRNQILRPKSCNQAWFMWRNALVVGELFLNWNKYWTTPQHRDELQLGYLIAASSTTMSPFTAMPIVFQLLSIWKHLKHESRTLKFCMPFSLFLLNPSRGPLKPPKSQGHPKFGQPMCHQDLGRRPLLQKRALRSMEQALTATAMALDEAAMACLQIPLSM